MTILLYNNCQGSPSPKAGRIWKKIKIGIKPNKKNCLPRNSYILFCKKNVKALICDHSSISQNAPTK